LFDKINIFLYKNNFKASVNVKSSWFIR